MFRTCIRRTAAPVLLLLVFMTGCVVSRSPITGNKRAYAYSWEEEQQIGREADGQIIAQYGLYDDPSLATYVDSLGQELLAVSHLRRADAKAEWKNTEFHFRVLDSPVVNAFALPGGYVYITRGLLAHAENEAQLAVVMGHEIGHVAGRHGSKRALNQLLGQGALLAGAIGGQMIFGGDAAQNVLNLGGTAAQYLFLSYSRDDEREADNLGVEYASMASYDASRGGAFFHMLQRMGEQSGQEIPTFQSTHPDPGEREQTIQEQSAIWAGRVQSTDKVSRGNLLQHVDHIIYGENPRQGFVRGGMFHHPELKFSFPVPSGFQVANQPTQVALVEQNGQALIALQIDNESASARSAADAVQSNQNVTVAESGQASANGLTAYYVIYDATTSEGQQLRIRNQFIDHGGNVYAFTGMTLRSEWSSWASVFDNTMRGFRPLTDPSLLAVQPSRLQVERASSTAALSSLIPATLPEDVTQLDVAILNQMELEESVAAGSLFKLVR